MEGTPVLLLAESERLILEINTFSSSLFITLIVRFAFALFVRFILPTFIVLEVMAVDSGAVSDTSASSDISPTADQIIRRFVKSMVTGCIFVGSFVEKRLVPDLNEYRHIIKIDEDEHDVIRYLKAVKKKINESHMSGKWIGFTDEKDLGAPAGCSIWTSLSQEIFGKYWLKIQSVHFHSKEVKFRLQILRPYESKSGIDLSDSIQEILSEPNISEKLQFIFQRILSSLKYFSLEIATPKNILDCIIFISLLVSSLITGGFQIIHYLLEYLLKLLHSMQSLIVALTPTCIALINALTYMVFGFYKLIGYLFKGESQPRVAYVVGPSTANRYYITPSRFALPEPPNKQKNRRYQNWNSRVHITELN